MKHARESIALAALVCAFGLGLTGCGGGGGDSGTSAPTPTPTTRTAAEGSWCAIEPDGSIDQIILLDDGSAWGLYGEGVCGSSYTDIYDMYHGTYTINGNNVSVSTTEFDYSSFTSGSGYLISGTASAQSALNLVSNGSIAFTMSYLNAYDQPASLAALAGNYSGATATTAVYGAPTGNLTISGSTWSMPADVNGCSASGTVAPHSTAHGVVGVFDLSLTFNSASCALGNGTTVKGIAIQSSDGNQVYAMTVTPDGAKDFFVWSVRQ